MKRYQIWSEGYAATGEHQKAFRLLREGADNSLWKGETFQDACISALKELGWDMKSYDEKNNSFWACKLYDNEEDARKNYG